MPGILPIISRKNRSKGSCASAKLLRKRMISKCKFNGGTVPIGYIIDNKNYFQLNLDTAPLVLEIFQLYHDGRTMKQIADS